MGEGKKQQVQMINYKIISKVDLASSISIMALNINRLSCLVQDRKVFKEQSICYLEDILKIYVHKNLKFKVKER